MDQLSRLGMSAQPDLAPYFLPITGSGGPLRTSGPPRQPSCFAYCL